MPEETIVDTAWKKKETVIRKLLESLGASIDEKVIDLWKFFYQQGFIDALEWKKEVASS